MRRYEKRTLNVPVDDDSTLIELAEVDTGTVRYMVLIARAGRVFENPSDPMLHHPSRLLQRTFGDCEVIVISSYFNQPALPHTIDLVPFTTKETGPRRGLEWWEVYNLYTEFYSIYAKGYFEQIYQE